VTAAADIDLVTPLYRLGTIGIFCTEVQTLVMAGAADCGVHSAKDLPTTLPAGLVLAAVLRRGDPRDALIGADSIAALADRALIGTSSLRRQAQLSAIRPDLRFVPLRGNVQTRLEKIASGTAAATILAQAGLVRLGLARTGIPLDPVREMTPAPAQGAIAIDCRTDDQLTRFRLAAISDRTTTIAISIERAVLAGLAGGCSLPLGAHAWRDADGWQLRVRLGTASNLVEGFWRGPASGLANQALAKLVGVRLKQEQSPMAFTY
jgi:hydroxymethylbilane synthase